ncbi:terminase large subunit domain-containing protein [Streptomyces rimosus]|uniref:phage terminase large subunit family protein n=1 Tax=Streptomyces rimosus TaxID=1927 RepID=UPI00067C52F0|nr:terminase family protein [Streptomyces rimosus]
MGIAVEEQDELAGYVPETFQNEVSQETVDQIIDKMLLVVDELSGHPLRHYQEPLARRILESMILGDAKTITSCMARQSGKTETIVNTIAAAMIMFPKLARIFPTLMGRFAEGVWVGAFAPVDDMADNLYSRFVTRLTSERAQEIMQDPEVDDKVTGKGRELKLVKSGSLVRKQTCHPRAQIEGRTYHVVLVDEAQVADERVINKSISPMLSSTRGTMVLTGTPTYSKGIFYKIIQQNKRMANKRGQRQNHFEATWKDVAKAHPDYGIYIEAEKLKIGEDSDEFKLSYRLIWMLDRGMLTTGEKFEALCDSSMQVVKAWNHTPVLVGIDPARKQDSTIVTVTWIDWDHPDEFGTYEHRVLNWLDLSGLEWEEQYYRIVDWLSAYNIWAICIDVGGVGDVVASRLKVLMPHVEIVECNSDLGAQSKRWKHLMELMRQGKIAWPGHSKARRLKVWQRFQTQMEDAELRFQGPNVIVEAPDETGAHDDYVDSLALSVWASAEMSMPEIQTQDNFFYR